MSRERVPLLFTPGPLTTSPGVKQAMLRDLGSRDDSFIETVARVRDGLLALAGVSRASGWEAVPVQGCGTYGLEAAISSLVPASGRLLVASNGPYAERLATIAATHGIGHEVLRFDEDEPVDPDRVDAALARDAGLSHVALVHCETSTGLLNPVEAVGEVARARQRVALVDSMSAFGGVPLDLAAAGIDVLVSSSNKCIEGVPGFAFVLVRRDTLVASEGSARTLSLDLLAQWRGLEKDGQFRFTPPTHAFLAFDRALRELAEEGGVEGRARRYRANHRRLLRGTRALGLREYLPEALQSWIITSFLCPPHPAFDFEDLYARVKSRGCLIYPGKVSRADCFRIGTIGHIDPDDIDVLVTALGEALGEMGVVAL